MQIPRTFSFNVPDEQGSWKSAVLRLVSELATFFTYVTRAINKGLTFGNGTDIDNIKGAWATFTSNATPDAEFSVSHNLGRAPVGWLVFTRDKAGVLYLGVSAWTTTQVFLKCNVASVTFKVFFVQDPAE